MIGPLLLALRHARHNMLRTGLMVLCVAAAAFVPIAARVAVAAFRERLTARAEQTPLLVGAAGSRFDLVMAALYFRRTPLDLISMGDFQALQRAGGAALIPLHARFTARGHPIVATTPEYRELRALTLHQGAWPALLGEAAIGARAARSLGITTLPAEVHSDPSDLYELAAPSALRLRITGILDPAGTPDDDAVFVALGTAWILEGRSHAHGDPARDIPAPLLLQRDERSIAVSEALVEDYQVTDNNIHAFHLHGDERSLPLTAIIAVPDSPRDGTLLRARLSGAGKPTGGTSRPPVARGATPPAAPPSAPSAAAPTASPNLRAIVPSDVVDDLLAHVFRIRALIDGLSVLLALLACAVVGLVTALSARARARELHTLSRIGAGRLAIFSLLGWEVAAVVALGLSLAGGAAALLSAFPPDLAKLL